MQRSYRLAIASVIAIASTAAAEARDLVTRPLVLAPDQIAADLHLEIGLDKNYAGDVVSFAPDAWWGVARNWTLGVTHGNASVDRIDAGATVCIRRTSGTCDRAYHGSNVDLRWLARDGSLAIAPRARLLVRDVDPWKPALTLGALVRWTRGRFAITSDPYLRLGLLNTGRGNRTNLVVPLWLAMQPAPRLMLAVHTGYDADLAVALDGFHVPLTLVLRAAVTAHVDLVVEGGFPSTLGPQNTSGTRSLILTFAWRS
ncbi:MAG: hypothetical protein H0T79_19695 [Deltaproteobacteria bacterium]|nr:hypothetical protein [Deltaproteobacteria bacterium]